MLKAVVDREDDFTAPLKCGCGKKVAATEMKFKTLGRAACLAIVFTGNKGWYADRKNPRKAFKDVKFLPALEKLLGTPVEVLAVST